MCVISYLVAVYSVLGRPGGDGDGIWLAATISLTVSIFTSLPEHNQNERLCLNHWQTQTEYGNTDVVTFGDNG